MPLACWKPVKLPIISPVIAFSLVTQLLDPWDIHMELLTGSCTKLAIILVTVYVPMMFPLIEFSLDIDPLTELATHIAPLVES